MMNNPAETARTNSENGGEQRESQTAEPWRDRNLWLRFVLMLLFAAVYWFAQFAVGLTALVQFIFAAISGKRSEPLHRFAAGLSAYVTEIIDFLMFQSEHRPFPFNEFPENKTVPGSSQAMPRKTSQKSKGTAT